MGQNGAGNPVVVAGGGFRPGGQPRFASSRPRPKSGGYVLHFDLRIFSTLALYWKRMVLPSNWPAIGIGKHAAQAAVVLLSLAFATTVVAGIRVGHIQILFGLFGLAWFLICLAPLLPLAGQRSDYHLSIPATGIARTAAQGISQAYRSGWGWCVVVAVGVLTTIRMDRIAAQWWREADVPIRAVVLVIGQARDNHLGKAIVLTGVTDNIYNDAVAHSALPTEGVDRVYLTPESRDSLHPEFDPEIAECVVMEPAVLRRALVDETAMIYSVAADHLRNVTEGYSRRMLSDLPDSAPRRVKVGDPLYACAPGPEWGPIVSGTRTVPAQATLRRGSPRNGTFLVLDGTYETVRSRTAITGGANPERPFSHLKVSLDGIVAPETAARDWVTPERGISDSVAPRNGVNESKDGFHRLFDLPAVLRDRELEVECRFPAGTGNGNYPVGPPVRS